MKRGALALLLLSWGCRQDDGDLILYDELLPPGAVSADAAASAEADLAPDVTMSPLPPACVADTGVPARTLECTGLYAAIAGKQIALGVRAFTPAVPLWSDGAEKQRWIFLPPGTSIDTSNPNEWVFPVGTKAWKEFSSGGQRVETRLWQKVDHGFWVKATYAWNQDESAAVQSRGGDVALRDGSKYHIPTADECQQCHRGRKENLLGFEQVSLGLAGATGITLRDLVNEGRLTVPPARTSLTIGDDGTGAAAAALGWLHINCGTTCHNANSNAVAYSAGMLLRLDPNQLDGRSALGFDALRTTVGIPGKAPSWQGTPRIIPGDPSGSLLFQLISTRGVANQMPPIATAITDAINNARIAAWIAQMPPLPAPGGPGDAAADGPVDGGGDRDGGFDDGGDPEAAPEDGPDAPIEASP